MISERHASERLRIARAERKAARLALEEEREIAAEKEEAYQAGLELARMKLTREEREAIYERGERSFDSKYEFALKPGKPHKGGSES